MIKSTLLVCNGHPMIVRLPSLCCYCHRLQLPGCALYMVTTCTLTPIKRRGRLLAVSASLQHSHWTELAGYEVAIDEIRPLLHLGQDCLLWLAATLQGLSF